MNQLVPKATWAKKSVKKALVAGWFSFEVGHATAGDLLAADLVCEWLESADYSYDVALAPPFRGGVDWRTVAPQNYSDVVFVCGPFTNRSGLELEFLSHFTGCRIIGVNLSMLKPLHVWNPFDVLLERDSSAGGRPDIVFLSSQAQVPTVGTVLLEHGSEARTYAANAAIGRLVDSREISVVDIDTRLDIEGNSTGLRSPAEIESLIARMDFIVTTRLHGMVLALKNGVPALAIDPYAGGAKVRRQAETVGWPVIFNVDALTDEALQEAFDYCLTADARAKARECYKQAMTTNREMRDEFILSLTHTNKSQQALPVRSRRWLQDQWQSREPQRSSERSLDNRDSELRMLRRKNRRLRRRVQRQNLELQNMRTSGSPRRLLEKIGRLLARLLNR
jgi:Polysaccharide pyruvyl transferase